MKPILDACCGGKMFYFDKNDDRVLFQDIRDIETTLCDGRHFEVVGENMYENAISCIEWLIKEGYFNKDYLI